MWLFFALTLLNAFSIYLNFKGEGLSNYSPSFSSYLIQTTLGKNEFIKEITRKKSRPIMAFMQFMH